MTWICYSCGEKNPNSTAQCKKCGGTVAAPSKFYPPWVIGGIIIFFGMVIFGTYLGGIFGGGSKIISIVAAFVFVLGGGFLMAFASPGKTIIEAAIGCLVGMVPAAIISKKFSLAFEQPIWLLIVFGVIAVILGAGGAWLGEKVQEKSERNQG